MTGHVRLSSIHSVSKLTHAQLVELDKKQEAAKARVMRKGRE